MGKRNPGFDRYIALARPFARPILKFLRKAVHAGCPDVEETIKWGMPHFEYCGLLCGMAAFKEHCSFGFWKGPLIVARKTEAGMGRFGRITSRKDLPDEKTLIRYVREAAVLNEQGVKVPGRREKRDPLPMPADLSAALRKNSRAAVIFKGFSPTNRRDYIEWITEAKRDETRRQRLKTAVEWMAEGKTRHWKYQPRAKA